MLKFNVPLWYFAPKFFWKLGIHSEIPHTENQDRSTARVGECDGGDEPFFALIFVHLAHAARLKLAHCMYILLIFEDMSMS